MTADHRVAVLGVMAEISDAEMQHKNIAQLAQDLGIEVIHSKQTCMAWQAAIRMKRCMHSYKSVLQTP
jgi:UDP-N-acetylmuramyl pentapeptide synthase